MLDVSMIVTLAGALAVALACGWATQRIGLSTLVGYMIAGIIVGPYTPGFVADPRLASQLANIGIILLMFGVGMHFHPEDLLRVWRIAVPGAIVRSLIVGAAGWGAARGFGWTNGAGVVFGIALAVASTVVLVRMLVERDRLAMRDGHVTVGWTIVEDLLTIAALIALPALAVGHVDATAMAEATGIAVGKVVLFAALLWGLGTRLVAPVMERIARTRSRELFTLTIFVIAVGVAALAAELFQISIALGAFLAGLVVGQSRIGPQAAADMAPFRDIFSALFFVSIGMLFNPRFVAANPMMVVATLAIVLAAKPLAAAVVVPMLGGTPRTTLTVTVGLAQIGEFSFILAAQAQELAILPAEGMDLLVAAAIVSIAINPLLFRATDSIERRFAAPAASESAAVAQGPPSAAPPVVITCASGIGRRLAERCFGDGVPVCVIDNSLDALEGFRGRGIAAVFGDAGRQEVLRAAGVGAARVIVVTDASLTGKMSICIAAREVNPRIAIVATADSAAERAWLEEFGAAFVCDALDELSEALLRSIRSGL